MDLLAKYQSRSISFKAYCDPQGGDYRVYSMMNKTTENLEILYSNGVRVVLYAEMPSEKLLFIIHNALCLPYPVHFATSCVIMM